MNKYVAAVLVVVVFAASVSLIFPRLAPIVARVSLAALLVVLAFWIYDYLSSRPPALAGRVYEYVRRRGPTSLRELSAAFGDFDEVKKAVDYLVERGVLRRFERGGEEYFDV
ncbi:MAG: transcriptional regulator [Pyrobaculum sp.]